jgi:16S rRNA C967 or C1407 C5-methylase (RsmB/RsmF family)
VYSSPVCLPWVELCSEVHVLLFLQAVALLKCGGTLLYSTCTVTHEENEGLVLWALKHFPNLDLKPAVPVLGGPGLKGSGLTEEQRQCVQKFGPPLLGNDCHVDTVGFFIACFHKKSTVHVT